MEEEVGIEALSLEDLIYAKKEYLHLHKSFLNEVERRIPERRMLRGEATDKQIAFVQKLLWKNSMVLRDDEYLDKWESHCIIQKLYKKTEDKIISIYFDMIVKVDRQMCIVCCEMKQVEEFLDIESGICQVCHENNDAEDRKLVDQEK